MRSAIAAACMASISVLSSAAAQPDPGYRIVQSAAAPGGSLQILEDARLTPALSHKMWDASTDPAFVLGEDSPEAHAFKARPLLPAKLRLVDAKGAALSARVLQDGAPLARIETRRLGPASRPTFLVTFDNSAGAGSYSGLVTRAYTQRGRRLEPVIAVDASGKAEKVSLANTLKSGWKVIDASPAHTVIEQLLCRPDFDHPGPDKAPAFQLTFVTYAFDGKTWSVARRVTPGMWESDGDWPARSEFPRPGA